MNLNLSLRIHDLFIEILLKNIYYWNFILWRGYIALGKENSYIEINKRG